MSLSEICGTHMEYNLYIVPTYIYVDTHEHTYTCIYVYLYTHMYTYIHI